MVDDSLPKHIGYIVDGNRRWAKKHGLPTYEGHLAGYNAIQDVARATLEAGVKYMSAYIFSTENWKRSKEEVGKLIGLVLRLLTVDLRYFDELDIRLVVLGLRNNIDDRLLQAINDAESRTAKNKSGTLALCFNYGGQLEIVNAARCMAQDLATNKDDIKNVSVDDFEKYLDHPEIPPCDLIVRTSGEQRLSNFMLWRAAYSEFIFLEKNWPDMTKDDVSAILDEYKKRSRRFGG